MSDEQLAKQIKEYQDLGKENPNVDVNMLMMNALTTENKKFENRKSYKWPYIIALGLPPLGLIFSIKYYFFSDDEEDKRAGNICVLLTVLSVVLLLVMGKIMFSTAGVTPQQIEQINPAQVRQELQ